MQFFRKTGFSKFDDLIIPKIKLYKILSKTTMDNNGKINQQPFFPPANLAKHY